MRRRLLLSYLAVALLVLGLLAIPLGVSYADNERQDLTHKVERDAIALSTLVEDALEQGTRVQARVSEIARSYTRETGGRVLVVDRSGHDLVDSAPHTGWISRYPLGIEATLVYGSIDYKFRNDTVTPVTIRTSSTGTSVTVELWGNQGGWQMSGFHPIGARSSRISVIDRGGADAKRVSASVTGSAPGVVRIERRRTGEPNDVRFWRYVS